MKPFKRKLILPSLITFSPALAGLFLWDRLPDQIATHFGPGNIPNGWSSKPFAVLAIPLFLTILHCLTIIVTLNDPKRQNIGRKMLSVIFWLIPVISLLCCLGSYAYALGFSVDIGLISNVCVGIVFILMGNYMAKNHQNYTVGIRLPWTLHHPENWNRTHRLASILWIISGFVFILNGFFQYPAVTFLTIVLCVTVPAVYSFFLYKKGI